MYFSKNQLYDIAMFLEGLHLCGCGADAVEKYGYIDKILRTYGIAASEREDYSDIATEVACNWLDHFGFIDHGSSIYSGWLTEKGTALLRLFDELGTNPDEWPGPLQYECLGDTEHSGDAGSAINLLNSLPNSAAGQNLD